MIAISIGKYHDVTPGKDDIDPEDQEAINKAKQRRSIIRMSALGIEAGDSLAFSRDSDVLAIVAENNKVIYQEEVMSLSAAAVKVLQQLGYSSTNASGFQYWMYEGETLDERRTRMEAEQFNERQD